MNKPAIDNTEKAKAKKKKDKLEVEMKSILEFTIGDDTLTGEDLAARADALAAAKKAVKTLEKTIKESEDILKSLMYKNWCQEVALNGHAPDMRQIVGATASFDVSQYTTADVSSDKVKALKDIGIDIESFAKGTKYNIRMGNVPTPSIEPMLAAIQEVLGEETYHKVVSVSKTVKEDFFSNLRVIVQESLGKTEKLTEKMQTVITTVKPTIQFRGYKTDLDPVESFDFAYEYAHVDNPDRK